MEVIFPFALSFLHINIMITIVIIMTKYMYMYIEGVTKIWKNRSNILRNTT